MLQLRIFTKRRSVMEVNAWVREHVIKPFKRSSKWRRVRKEYLAAHPKCAVCAGEKGLQVHHVRDFSTHPELELDKRNLMTLCSKRRCHLFFGHLNYWKSINPRVRYDARLWRKKIKNRRTKEKKNGTFKTNTL
jgi:5-methylcytosine-specific restriction endonuclease McrA